MPRHRTVLGNNRVIATQNSVMSSMTSLRRNNTQCLLTTRYASRCISCDQERFSANNNNGHILRCGLLADKFAWLCPSCSDDSDANDFFLNTRKQMTSNWIDGLPTSTATTSTTPTQKNIHRMLKLLKGGGPKDKYALVASVVVTTIASFLILVMLRPPIVTRVEQTHETPKINITKIVVWSLVAGTGTLFLSTVL